MSLSPQRTSVFTQGRFPRTAFAWSSLILRAHEIEPVGLVV
jgi:hypothetical protein